MCCDGRSPQGLSYTEFTMEVVDLFYNAILPRGLQVLMFGLGMSLTVGDITHIFREPRAVGVGLVGQLILLPALAFLLVELLSPAPAIAVGLIILAACPGGVTSNAYVFASRADLALSVSLTGICSFITVFTIPFLTYFALGRYYSEASIPDIAAVDMILRLSLLTILPIALGMIVRASWPEFAQKLIESLRTITLVFLILLVVAAAVSTFDVLVENFAAAALIALSLNVLAMAMGYGLGCAAKLPVAQRVSITYEVGVQNLALAYLVTLTLLDEPSLAASTLVYSLFMKLTALAFLVLARRWLGKGGEGVSVPVLEQP